MRSLALNRRNWVVSTISNLIHQSLPRITPLDPRTVRRLKWLIIAISLAGSLRLNRLLQALPYGKAQSLKAAETARSWSLTEARYPEAFFFARFRGFRHPNGR